jgi:hypothetical protein
MTTTERTASDFAAILMAQTMDLTHKALERSEKDECDGKDGVAKE